MKRFLVLGAVLSLIVPVVVAADKKKDQAKPPSPIFLEILKGNADTFLKQFDKNNDGYLSKEEMPGRLVQAFDKFDTNGDGKLDKKEIAQMIQVLRNRFGVRPEDPVSSAAVEAMVDRFLQRMDADKDGKISRKEAQARLAENFDSIDTNKDGYLDREELRRVAGRFLAAQKANAESALPGSGATIPDFDALDRNADGRLTADELQGTPYAGKLADIDSNGDGKIDRKEFEAYFRKKAEKSKEPKK